MMKYNMTDDEVASDQDNSKTVEQQVDVPPDWGEHCIKDEKWCQHFITLLLEDYHVNVEKLFPGFKEKQLTPSQLQVIDEKCADNVTLCEEMKRAKMTEETVLSLVKHVRSGPDTQSNVKPWIWIALVVFVILIVFVIVYIICYCIGKPSKSRPTIDEKMENKTNSSRMSSTKKSKKDGLTKRSLIKSKSRSKKRLSSVVSNHQNTNKKLSRNRSSERRISHRSQSRHSVTNSNQSKYN